MEMKQQEPQEEEITIQAMSALKISRKHRPQRHQPYELPTWGQIKILTNRAENLVFQQGMLRSSEYIFLAMPSHHARPPPAQALTYPTPLYYRWSNGQREDQSFQLMTLYLCPLPRT